MEHSGAIKLFGFQIKKQTICVFALLLMVCGIMSFTVGYSEKSDIYRLTDVLWTTVILTIVAIQYGTLSISEKTKPIIWFGLLLRIIGIYAQTYLRSHLPDFIVNDDQIDFLKSAYGYYHHEAGVKYVTNLPILMNRLFYVMGASEYVIRLVFVYAWFAGVILLVKVARKLSGNRHQLLVAFYSLMPWNLYISTGIFREPLKQFFLMLSIYFLWKWMCDGKVYNYIYSILGAVPALWLHSGEVWILGVIACTYLLWDVKKQSWRKPRPNRYMLLAIIGVCLIPTFYNVFVFMFPGKFSGTFSIENLLGQVVYTSARTNYVPAESLTVDTPGKFVYWTLYRMLYLWISPSPRFWNSPIDVVMFMMDVIPWVLFFILFTKACCTHKLDDKAKVAFIIVLFFSFIYAWGTRNAGTAMRHRDHVIGIMVMCALMRRKEDENVVCKY